MARTEVVFYREGGEVPVLAWLENLLRRERRAFAKCRARLELLEQEGHKTRRPVADSLRDGLYEPRARGGPVQYRLRYFFCRRHVAVRSHSIVKPGSKFPAQPGAVSRATDATARRSSGVVTQ